MSAREAAEIPRKSPTKTEAAMELLRGRIAARALAPGDRLPSVRGFARSLGLSPSTVAEVYDRLAAEGLVRARRGSGFYVAEALAPRPLAAQGPPRERAVDPFWISRQSLDADPEALKPGCGWLPSDWMPEAALRRALRALARAETARLTDYAGALGAPDLRRLLARRFAEEGLEAGPDQILLTGSTTQAADLICRALLRPGDRVLIDDPCYFNFQALLRAHPVTATGVPYTRTGPDLAAFEQALISEKPRLYLTNSAIHNPTGAGLSAPTAHRLLALAARHGLTIVEDEIFADFEPAPSPRLALLDGLERVIRIGGFSKTLSASLRCGYLVARPDLIEGFADLQIATNFGGSSLIASGLVAEALGGGGYRKHMEDLRRRLVGARKRARLKLEALGFSIWTEPRGGFHLWARLPEGLDSTLIAQRCLAEKVILAPGDAFSLSRSASGFLRFNVAQFEDERILRALGRAMAEGRG